MEVIPGGQSILITNFGLHSLLSTCWYYWKKCFYGFREPCTATASKRSPLLNPAHSCIIHLATSIGWHWTRDSDAKEEVVYSSVHICLQPRVLCPYLGRTVLCFADQYNSQTTVRAPLQLRACHLFRSSRDLLACLRHASWRHTKKPSTLYCDAPVTASSSYLYIAAFACRWDSHVSEWVNVYYPLAFWQTS